MSSEYFNQVESRKSNPRLDPLVDKLRSKLKNFAVIDRQNELVGEVKDLILDSNRQLNLVVPITNDADSRLFLLTSKLIQKIDPAHKSLMVDINKAELEQLPEYSNQETAGMEITENSNNPVTPGADAGEETITNIMSTEEDSQQQVTQPNLVESAPTEVLEDEIIRLLEERLVVNLSKRKVGEVIVRKEIETRMIQVPVRHEKLIVEQVSPERKQLAEIDLGQEEIAGIELNEATSLATESLNSGLTVKGEFNSPKIASLLLNAIALERRQGCKKVRVEIVVEDAERQKTYQEWVDRCSVKPS